MTIAQDANAIFQELTEDIGIEIPEIDISGEDFEFPFGKDSDSALYKEVQPLDLCALTDGTVDGNGAFDKVMQGIKAHLLEEFKGNRITGGEYTKAYIAMVEAGLANGVAFLLGKDRAFWEAQRAQIDAFRARVELETSKAQLALVSFQAKTAEAQYALAKMQALGASIEVETGKYRLDNMLPVEKDLLDGQKELQVLQIEGQNYTNQQLIYTVENLLPQQLLPPKRRRPALPPALYAVSPKPPERLRSWSPARQAAAGRRRLMRRRPGTAAWSARNSTAAATPSDRRTALPPQ